MKQTLTVCTWRGTWTNYTIQTEANHQGNPNISNLRDLVLLHSTGTRRNHDRLMRSAAIQTKWGGSEDERVAQIVCLLPKPGAKELVVAYEANRPHRMAL